MKTYWHIIFLASVLVLAGCSPASQTNTPVNDTSRLDDMTHLEPQSAGFVARVKLYYQSLENKDWPTSYDMRTADFKQNVPRDLYLKDMASAPRNLTSYKVLALRSYSGVTGGPTAAEMIMEFHEADLVLYDCSRWVKQRGAWVCDEPGLSDAFRNPVIPAWVPH